MIPGEGIFFSEGKDVLIVIGEVSILLIFSLFYIKLAQIVVECIYLPNHRKKLLALDNDI